MAEQVSHNVVNNTESTGGSPLVDVAANPTSIASAEHGTNEQPINETKTDNAHESQHANEHATDVNAIASAAEPSAGEAQDTIVETPTAASEPNTFDKDSAGQAPLVNGVSDAMSAGDGEGSVDLSQNSDNEGSRGDVPEQQKDGMHHVRSNSVKKPTTFSKVSVTKNFLAKSATAAPVAAKPSDKPSPAGTPPQAASIAKPRLIAKTGTSLRDIQKARLSAEPTGGPDASKVWNKNRRMSLQTR